MGRSQVKRLLKTADILPLLGDTASHQQEHFVVLSVDTGRKLITKRVVFIGTIDAVIATTQQLIAAGQILGVQLYDHVIVAGRRHYSFSAHGMMLP